MTYSSKETDMNDINSALKILNFNQLLIFEACKTALSFHLNEIPKNLSDMFVYKSNIHIHSTRGTRNSLHIPFNLKHNQLAYVASLNWNKYCLDLSLLNSKHLFYKKLKNKILNDT